METEILEMALFKMLLNINIYLAFTICSQCAKYFTWISFIIDFLLEINGKVK